MVDTNHEFPPGVGDRLALAVRLGLEFRATGRRDAEAFLAEHADLAELLAPMLGLTAEDDAPADEAAAVVAPELPWAIGTVFADYRIEGLLGHGGMGTVLLATQLRLGRPIALKILHRQTGSFSERARWRFQREARLMAELDHQGIVKVFEAGEHDGIPFYAMEYIEGASLRQLLGVLARGGLPLATARTLRAAIAGRGAVGTREQPASPRSYVDAVTTIGAELAEALACAHAAGIVHRDLKPANVLLRRSGQAMLVDFGIARREHGPSLTLTGDMAGTPHYMSPEQARGEPVDFRSDIFALGTLLYEALTLRRPFDGETTHAVLGKVQADDPEPLQRHNPQVPSELAAIVMQAMAKAPHERYSNAALLAQDLWACLRGDPVRAAPPSRWQRLRRWGRREPWRATAAAVGLGSLVALAIGAAMFTRELIAEGRRTSAALDEVHRLAIGVRLDRAERSAMPFAVAKIELVPAMQQWLRQEAEPLATELEPLEQLLLEVQQRADPYDDAAAASDRDSHPEASRLAELELDIRDRETSAEATEDDAVHDADLANAARLRQHREELLARLKTRRTWLFQRLQDQFLHEQIVPLLARLRSFAESPRGARARITAQIAWAQESDRRCQLEAASVWQQAAAEIAADVRFAGLRLAQQRDLLPLGKDSASGLWEFVHLRSGERGQEAPARRANGAMAVTEQSGIVFVLIPGGTFVMGAQTNDPTAPNHDPDVRDYEQPMHEIRLAPFLLGKHEITRGQWARLAEGDRPSIWRSDNSSIKMSDVHPVETVSCRRATAVLAMHGLSLPTEAQWEYGSRAGTQHKWFWSQRAEAVGHANFSDAAARRLGANWPGDVDLDDQHGLLAPVGSFAPNAFGCCDMLGNVAELTRDRALSYSRPVAPGDGLRLVHWSDPPQVMFRGGSFMNPLTMVSCADRSLNESPDYASGSLGVRAARALDP